MLVILAALECGVKAGLLPPASSLLLGPGKETPDAKQRFLLNLMLQSTESEL